MTHTIVDRLTFPEGPRWHAGVLYFSDMHAGEICAWSESQGLRTLAQIPGRPSGIGFLSDDVLLVTSQEDRCVYRVPLVGCETAPVVHADVSSIATWHLNDMITDRAGRAYVGNYGDGAPPGEPIKPATLALVQPSGEVTAAADDLYFPNGMVFRRGGAELVVAETRSTPGRLTVFDVGPDGSLSHRRTLTEFDSEWPDGLAIDALDGIWVASPFSGEVIRVDADGRVTDRIAIANPYAVALGGVDGRDLFVCTSESWEPERAVVERSGAIHVLRVEVPAEG
ncbi:SMP-30/gluconolactonase/LRE family protein [Microbacterium luticocti]|uniref:SMP-30/gluconolactonase/LRE family protein n=1 Tax=Microbacterium luticocti TaxID=451764 RepID=UPI0004906289|nr:SMP-30/gluconolactonase/LRE family protein [Microbacterium luticocti]